jgi:sterol desaturase/sphingolipid hydroxylase (fatty acid hydroxylase superfamily)
MPSAFEIFYQIIFCMIVEDFLFYVTHRVLHHRKLYSIIHKIHHQHQTTVSIASEYSHPIEFIFSSLLPTTGGAFILGSRMHFLTYLAWIFLRIAETTDGHSGYEFTFSPFRLIPF